MLTVALSGDGADELFAGYNKHAALYRLWHPGAKEKMVSALNSLWNILPKSRNNPLGNLTRQLKKFADASKLDIQSQYWALAKGLQSVRKSNGFIIKCRFRRY